MLGSFLYSQVKLGVSIEREACVGNNSVEAWLGGHPWHKLADGVSEPLLTMTTDGRLEYVNAAIEAYLGYPAASFILLFNQLLGADQDRRLMVLQEAIERQRVRLCGLEVAEYTVEVLELQHRDGFHVACELLCVAQPAGGMLCLLQRGQNAEHQHASQALAAKVLDSSLSGIYITDTAGNIVQVNRAFSRLTEYSAAEVLGQSPQCMDVECYAATYFKSISDSLERNDRWEGEIQHRRKGGQVFPAWVSITVLRDEQGVIINTISHFSDITEKKNSDHKIHRLAYMDPLTNLPNRSLFADRFAQAISRAKRQNAMVALLFLDLDRFKVTNDSLGYACGDRLLRQAAQRLRDCVRTDDTVARMGGDEFAVTLGDLSDRAAAMTAAAHIAEKIRHVLAEPYLLDEKKVYSGASIGIAFYPSDGAEPSTLMEHADTAMYHAKELGKNNYQFYTASLNDRARERLALEEELRQAIDAAQLELYYQPILSASEGVPVAVEALVRWQHPSRGMIMPNEFIALAEESGLIRPLGTWVLREACAQLRAWQEQGIAVERIAINISAKQFTDGRLVQTLREVMAEYHVDPACIELELTESTLMVDPSFAQQALEELKRVGVRVAIDDFGSGYSSLSHLKHLPIDTLKVDRSFIRGLPAREDKQIVQAILALGKSLDLRTVAEGIENPLQLEFVQGLSCDEVQGFMLSQPMPAKDVMLWQ
jgi:diguanylate cyclase (GGDEF)-like protein/PAS domain S-box-containing protein